MNKQLIYSITNISVNFTKQENNIYDNIKIGWIQYIKGKERFVLLNKDNKYIGNIIIHNNNSIMSRLLDNILHDKTSIWDYTITKPLANSKYYENNNYQLNIYLLVSKFKKALNDKLKDIDYEIFYYLYVTKNKLKRIFNFDNSWKKPHIVNIHHESLYQPNTQKMKLRTYQLKTLDWMIKVEKCMDNHIWNFESEFKLSELIDNKDLNDLKFDLVNRRFIIDDYHEHKLYTKGGILADEMGLGKTITTISLMLAKPSPKKKLFSDDNRLNTKANLIVCPNHLAKQWEDEIKKCNPLLKTVLILTKTNHLKTLYNDIINADIVITSFQFLTNFSYYVSLRINVSPSFMVSNFEERIDIYKNQLDQDIQVWKLDTNSFLNLTSPILEYFNWHRLIIDEGHEIFGEMSNYNASSNINYYLQKWLINTEATYKWYITGTPFVHINGFKSVMKFLDLHTYKRIYLKNNSFLDIKLNFNNLDKDGVIGSNFIDKIFKTLYYRNTKESVGNEFDVPPILEETIFLELTPIERHIYNSHLHNGVLYLRQLCCHPQISDKDREYLGTDNIKSLDDVKERIINNKKESLLETERKLRLKLEEINGDQEKLKSHKTSLDNLRNKISELKYVINIFNNLDPMNPVVNNETCSICMCELDDPVVTKCAHYYCKECITMALTSSNKKVCPICRSAVSFDDIYSVAKIDKKDENAIDKLTYKYGSKLGKLIGLCKQLLANKDNKIIIFSQWDRMLHMIGVTLEENDIDNVYCKGNVHQRNKAIDKFKKGLDKKNSPRVIMLSLEHAASGTNLTEASHIIMVEPIDGINHEEVISVRGQAIGRAIRISQTKQVKVIDLVVKDTVEFEIYNKYLQV
jgi:SNF2 family DNA or RNA helicase